MPNINLSNELYTQLGALVVGFNDTPEVVIERLIQENERLSQERLSQERKASPAPEENQPIPGQKKTRRKITFEDVKTLHPIAKDIADGKKTRYTALGYIGMKMNRGSANTHISRIPCTAARRRLQGLNQPACHPLFSGTNPRRQRRPCVKDSLAGTIKTHHLS